MLEWGFSDGWASVPPTGQWVDSADILGSYVEPWSSDDSLQWTAYGSAWGVPVSVLPTMQSLGVSSDVHEGAIRVDCTTPASRQEAGLQVNAPEVWFDYVVGSPSLLCETSTFGAFVQVDFAHHAVPGGVSINVNQPDAWFDYVVAVENSYLDTQVATPVAVVDFCHSQALLRRYILALELRYAGPLQREFAILQTLVRRGVVLSAMAEGVPETLNLDCPTGPRNITLETQVNTHGFASEVMDG